MAANTNFDETDHPRTPNGRFAHKTTPGGSGLGPLPVKKDNFEHILDKLETARDHITDPHTDWETMNGAGQTQYSRECAYPDPDTIIERTGNSDMERYRIFTTSAGYDITIGVGINEDEDPAFATDPFDPLVSPTQSTLAHNGWIVTFDASPSGGRTSEFTVRNSEGKSVTVLPGGGSVLVSDGADWIDIEEANLPENHPAYDAGQWVDRIEQIRDLDLPLAR